MSKPRETRTIAHFKWDMTGADGIERVVTRSAEAMLDLGYDVWLATTEPCNLALPEGLRRVTGREHRWFGRLTAPGLAMRLRRVRPDIVHVHGLNSKTGALHAAGRWTRLWSPYFDERLGSGRSADGWRAAFRSILDVHPNVVFVSETERDAFIEFTGQRPKSSMVAAVGPSWADGRGPSRRPGELIIAAGRLTVDKRFDLVVAAAARVGHLDQLRIIGEGPVEAELRAQVEQLGGDPDSVIRGVRSVQDVVAMLSRAAVVVSMSEYEAFDSAVWDGLLAGCGLVMSDLACHREVLTHHPTARARLVPLGDVDAAAQALAAVLGLPGDRSPWSPMPTWGDAVQEIIAFAEGVRGLRR